MELTGLLALAESTLRLSIPLLCACLAGLWSERSGVIDIGLEGKLLIAAFAAAATSYTTGSAYWGLLAGIGASTVFALVHGFASISQRGNQIVSGVAVNMLAAGLTAVIGNAWYGQGGRTPPLEGEQRFLALFDVSEAPRLVQVLLGQSFLVYLALLLVPLTWYVLAKTRFGLRLRAVGEKPAAVDTAGISVTGLRYSAVIIAGVFCGIGGAYIGTGLSAGFIPAMTAGKGFIALAALIFAKWRAWPALAACVLFGFLEALSIRLQGVDIPGLGEVPVQAIQALPYAMTVILLAGFVGRAIPPRAAGQPYVKER